MPVFVLKTIMPIDEYRKWIDYFKENDTQPDVPELQMATLIATVRSALGTKSSPKDFIIRKKAEKITPKSEVQQMRGIFSMLSTKKKE